MPTDSLLLALEKLVPSPEQYSLEAWVDQLERFYGRTIHFVPYALPTWVFGARIIVDLPRRARSGEVYPCQELVLFARWLPEVHQEHIKAHELAHIALGHLTSTLDRQRLQARPPSRPIPRDGFNLLMQSEPSLCCRVTEIVSPNTQRWKEDLEAEDLTRRIYQRVFNVRQRATLRKHSSESDLERAWRRMGIE